jgi:hypothetical protein
LRVALSDEDFRKWLRMPNGLLDGKIPLALIAQGKWQLVADYVADMITGSPSWWTARMDIFRVLRKFPFRLKQGLLHGNEGSSRERCSAGFPLCDDQRRPLQS